MSMPVKDNLNFFQALCVKVFRCGPIPKHVAFIMDGNRRYAKKNDENFIDCYSYGFNKFMETITWCAELGITELTYYAFSIENFKRNKTEVEDLMKVALEKFQYFLNNKDVIMNKGICLRVFGNFSLIPEELRKVMVQLILMSKENNKIFLNIAVAYNSTEEIINTINDIVDGVKKRIIKVEDIDEYVISECLYTNFNIPPDIIIRTSGEARFSNFLLWQIGNSLIHFCKVFWPEFYIWHLLVGILKYQNAYGKLKKYERLSQGKSQRTEEFLQKVKLKRLMCLKNYLN